jgi:hypothetical protein
MKAQIEANKKILEDMASKINLKKERIKTMKAVVDQRADYLNQVYLSVDKKHQDLEHAHYMKNNPEVHSSVSDCSSHFAHERKEENADELRRGKELKIIKSEIKFELDRIEEYMGGQEIAIIKGNADVLSHM